MPNPFDPTAHEEQREERQAEAARQYASPREPVADFCARALNAVAEMRQRVGDVRLVWKAGPSFTPAVVACFTAESSWQPAEFREMPIDIEPNGFVSETWTFCGVPMDVGSEEFFQDGRRMAYLIPADYLGSEPVPVYGFPYEI